jgi:hypothetical protein
MFILIGPHVEYLSDGNQTVCPTLKKLILASNAKTTRTGGERCLFTHRIRHSGQSSYVNGSFLPLPPQNKRAHGLIMKHLLIF